MKKYTDLEKLLLDFTNDLIDMIGTDNINTGALADKYTANNSLAQDESPSVQHNEAQKKPCTCIDKCYKKRYTDFPDDILLCDIEQGD